MKSIYYANRPVHPIPEGTTLYKVEGDENGKLQFFTAKINKVIPVYPDPLAHLSKHQDTSTVKYDVTWSHRGDSVCHPSYLDYYFLTKEIAKQVFIEQNEDSNSWLESEIRRIMKQQKQNSLTLLEAKFLET